MQPAALLQETPARPLVAAPAGTAAVSTVQCCPSHRSASGPEAEPVPADCWPTAMQLLALAHETADSPPLAEPREGVASTCQLVPSHASASGSLGLPGAAETSDPTAMQLLA